MELSCTDAMELANLLSSIPALSPTMAALLELLHDAALGQSRLCVSRVDMTARVVSPVAETSRIPSVDTNQPSASIDVSQQMPGEVPHDVGRGTHRIPSDSMMYS